MSEKVFSNVRVKLKYDTEENWNKATNFVPMRGEVIIYTPTNDTTNINENSYKIKIGDGTRTVINLPFATNLTAISDDEIDSICVQCHIRYG